MSPSNLLLFWVSARQSVSAAAFDEACLRLGRKAAVSRPGIKDDSCNRRAWRRRLGEPLYRLGHIEFQALPAGYAVVPPTLIWHVGASGEAVGHLCGARSPALANQLADLFGDRFRIRPQQGGPERWMLRGNHDQLERELADMDIRVSLAEGRGLALLACLPPLEAALQHQRAYQSGRHVTHCEQCVFTPEGRTLFHWRKQAENASLSNGLYRERGQGHVGWFHLQEDLAARLETSEQRLLAWWLERSRSRACRLLYHPAKMILSVPVGGLPLPVLLDRPLRLASGRCPRQEDTHRWWRYRDIDGERARQFARVLGVVLEPET
jgi:hypothetical protein